MTTYDAVVMMGQIRTYLTSGSPIWRTSSIDEACSMAIKALEGQKEGKWEKRKVKVMCPRDCWYPSGFAIDGTWNEEEGWNLVWQGEFCSNCGKQYDWQHNFCPNCGAKMKGEYDAD